MPISNAISQGEVDGLTVAIAAHRSSHPAERRSLIRTNNRTLSRTVVMEMHVISVV